MFKVHTKQTAPLSSQTLADESVKAYGFLPNLHAVLAEAPLAYKAYLETFNAFAVESSFSNTERHVVFQTSNYLNNCSYCMPGHSMIMTLLGCPADVIEALREGTPIADPKLQALRVFTQQILEKKGHLQEVEIQEFFNAGYNQKQALEILVGLASKLISNFTNALAKTPLDEPVKKFAWIHPSYRKENSK